MIARISPDILATLEQAALRAAPMEACALLFGDADDRGIAVTDIQITDNLTAGDPERTFEIDPTAHLKAQKAARAGGFAIIGVWHSHPAGRAEPSGEDRARSIMPSWLWIITATGEKGVETKAFLAGADDASQIEECTLQLSA